MQTIDTEPVSCQPNEKAATSVRLSVIIEWANTLLNGTPRAKLLFDILARQWEAITRHEYPPTLPPEACRFLDQFDPRAQVLIISGDSLRSEDEQALRMQVPDSFDLGIHVKQGLEYYPLKNFGAALASGDLLLFVDSDVLPEDGWFAHLLASFHRPDVQVVCGQTYVVPDGLFASAFALGWTYDLRDDSGVLIQPTKFYANNIVFRADVFRQTGFAALGKRSRGASSLLRKELSRRGVCVWENRSARVGHPPPSSFRHMAVRALAHGRDHYMKDSEGRTIHGLMRSVGIAAGRLGRGVIRTFRYGKRVGLKVWELPPVVVIICAYYGFFALGGMLTHVSPEAMGRRFRV
jgi:hypothetical protein